MLLAACGTKSDPPPPPPPAPAPVAVDAAVVEPPPQIPCAVTVRIDADGAAIASAVGGCRAPRNAGALDVGWIEGELKNLRGAFGTCPVNVTVASTSGAFKEALQLVDLSMLLGIADANLATPGELRFANIDSKAPHCKLPHTGTAAPPPPAPPAKGPTQQAPVIAISKTAVTFGKTSVPVEAVAKDPAALAPITEAMRKDDEAIKVRYADKQLPADLAKSCDDALQNIRPAAGHVCPIGLAVLQVDGSVDMAIVNAVLLAAHGVGYDNLLYAVK